MEVDIAMRYRFMWVKGGGYLSVKEVLLRTTYLGFSLEESKYMGVRL